MPNQKSIWYFSKIEKRDLLVSWITLSIAFAMVLMSVDIAGLLTGNFIQSLPIELAFPISFVAVGTGFVFHELAHRQAARHYGFPSEYRAWYQMLGLALVFAVFTGWIIAAPGATYFHAQNLTRRKNGIISIAGPLVNVILGISLLIISLIFANELIKIVLIASARINFFFALFNLLPVWLLDGKKVLLWSPIPWAIVIAIPAIAFLFPNLIFGFFI